MKTNDLEALSSGDIIYSAIPYDTSRKHIQRATIQYLLYLEVARKLYKGCNLKIQKNW